MAPKSTPSVLARAPRFRRRLLAWFHQHGRELPWRRTRDPYRVLVSEVMLQQTQVARVAEYYPRFLNAFPTLHHLAKAPAAQVREQWNGLGYYRRAANLHRLAREVVEHHDGGIPTEPEQLRLLPGVGRYTAGAVASFAFERTVAAVDTNVARVLRRAFHSRLPRGARGERRLWDTATALLPRNGRAAWAFNQAVMELGALVCTARLPKCAECPVAPLCITGRRRAGRR
ncbi:MAG TPA: A/G-specific adenine glycosylase [Gemmatimonadales bacterium]|jgi:A/G-specific adenine glycosylase|nr:A/G-specific adenine glycosylase [Gemmatimonadales bacterium]